MVSKHGLLYAGDSKMSALETRADIVSHGDYYLVPLPLTGKTREQVEDWIGAVVDGEQCAHHVEWTQRVQLVRSVSLARYESEKLDQRLSKAETALLSLTPEPGRGKRQYRDEATFYAAVAKVLEGYKVTGLLDVTWQREEQKITHYVGRGNRPKKTETLVRYVITGVERNHSAIQKRKHRLGWRVHATNMPEEQMPLAQSVIHYRGGWSLERDFDVMKNRPLGISPLYVRRDDQIIGLTHLLTLALRLLTLIQTQVRSSL